MFRYLLLFLLFLPFCQGYTQYCTVRLNISIGTCWTFCNRTQVAESVSRNGNRLWGTTLRYVEILSINASNVFYEGLDVNGKVIVNGTMDSKRTYEIAKENQNVAVFRMCKYGGLPSQLFSAKGTVYSISLFEVVVVLVINVLFLFLGAIAIGFCLMLCLFYKRQPLKSRGAIPLFMAGFFVLKVPIIIGTNVGSMVSWEQELPCFMFIELTVAQFIYYGAFCNHVRFLLNVKLIKAQISLKEGSNKAKVFLIRALKFMSSNTFFVFTFIVAFFLICLPTVIMSAISCSNVNLIGVLVGLSFLQLALTTVIYTIIFLIDMLNHIKILCKPGGCKKLLCTKDPLRFRTEYLMYIFGPLLILIACIYIAVVGITFIDTKNNLSSTEENTRDVLNYFLPVFLLVLDAYFLGVTSVFPFILTLVGICRKSKVSDSELHTVLGDPALRQLFDSFCKAEFSSENLMCWDEIQSFKQTPTEVAAREIYEKFLVAGAPIEVNIPGSQARTVNTKLSESKIESDLFEDIERQMCQNMYDTFSRFGFTDEFLKMKEKDKLIKQI